MVRTDSKKLAFMPGLNPARTPILHPAKPRNHEDIESKGDIAAPAANSKNLAAFRKNGFWAGFGSTWVARLVQYPCKVVGAQGLEPRASCV